MKPGKWSFVTKILFTYLAVNKILYWFNMITAMEQTGFTDVVWAVFSRLLNHDLIIIIGVAAFFAMDKWIETKKLKYNNLWVNVIFYAIGYVVMMVIIFIYNIVLNLIFEQNFSFGEFMRQFISFLPSGTLGYLSVVVVLEIKQHFKSKEKKPSALTSPN